VAVAGAAGEEAFQVGCGDLGPAGDPAGAGEAPGEVAEDTEPGFQGDVAEQPASCPAVTFPLGELLVVERGDRGGKSRGEAVEVALPPRGGRPGRPASSARGR
jgi:hypothetical protein